MAKPIKNQAQTKTVTLEVAIDKDGTSLTEIELSKPHAGQLRGLSLIDVCEMKFEAAEILLPRISCLNERDLINMEAENWPPLLTTIASFFVNMER